MSDEFETIATFHSVIEANLAKNHLEDAGIPAFLEGEETVAMAWHLANAMGGVRLMVAAKDAYRANACLVDPSAPERPAAGEAASDAESTGITAQRNRAARTGMTKEPSAPVEDEAEVPTSTREQNASRAWRGAVLGLVLWPLQAYVFYLLFRVYLSDEELGPDYRWRVWSAAAINLPFMLVATMLFRACMAD